MPALSLLGNAPVLGELAERLGASGLSVARVQSIAEGLHHDRLVAYAVGQLPEVLNALSPDRAARVTLFVENPIEEELLAVTSTLGAVLIKQGSFTIEEVELATRKVLDPSPLGLERYVPGHGTVHELTLRRSSERGDVLMQLDRFVTALSIDPRRVSQILTVADELVTNAFYHAPIDGIGGHPYSHVSRMDSIQAHPNRPVELRFASNATRVAIGVRDRYGSLEQNRVRSHLARAIANPKANFRVSSGAGGAGLGLINAVRGASQLVFNIVPGHLTEAIGVLETAGNYRKFLEEGRSLQLYGLPPTAIV